MHLFHASDELLGYVDILTIQELDKFWFLIHAHMFHLFVFVQLQNVFHKFFACCQVRLVVINVCGMPSKFFIHLSSKIFEEEGFSLLIH
jgi:hypothetical protein